MRCSEQTLPPLAQILDAHPPERRLTCRLLHHPRPGRQAASSNIYQESAMQTKANNPESGVNGLGVAAATTDAAPSGVSREFHNFLTDVEDLVKSTTSLTGEDLARAKAKLAARVAAARDSVEKMGGAIADRARNTVKATDGYVHEQPWQAIGIGAAAGLLIGFLLARRG
jgi:ElaB/YqjD/DUF883 family membrane-anchored ribosome-binding protein